MSKLVSGNPLANIDLEAPTVAASSLFKRKDSSTQRAVELQALTLPQGSTTTLEIDAHQSRPQITHLGSQQELLLNPDHGVEFPEGGLKAYSVIFGAFMGLIPAFGLVNSVGAIESYISENQLAQVSTSTISWIFTINTFVTFSSMIFSGALFDRNGSFGPLLTGSVLFCGGLVATASATNTWQFLVTLAVVGMGSGVCIAPLCGAVSHYFNKKRATAISLATAGGSIGGIVLPLMLRGLYSSVGFAWALRIVAAFSAFCFGCAILTAKERFKSDKKKITSTKEFFEIYLFDLFDYKALLEPRFLFCSVGVAFSECALIVASIYYPSYIIKRGYGQHTAYLMITVINTTGIPGRYIPGLLADKYIGRFNIAICTVLLCTVFIFALWLPFGSHLNVLYAFSAIYGFFSGSILTLPPVLCGQISRTESFGKRYSTMYMFVSVLSLAVVPIGGAIIGDSSISNYNNFIVYVGMLMIAGSVLYFVCRYCSVGFKLCKY